jgi:spore coat polysaccharide biosynthesis protein SpsF
MTSNRLPGKVLMTIGDKPALSLMISRLRSAKRLDKIIVATTTDATDDPVEQLCRDLDVEVFRGDEADVLGRYLETAMRVKADPVVRLTADCPMIDPELVDQAITEFTASDCDYISNGLVRTYPDGLDVEVFSFAALARAAQEAVQPYSREHVTPYIKSTGPEVPAVPFKVESLEYVADFGHVRWTLDTADDLTIIRELVELLPEGFTWLEALAMATRTPRLLG